MKTCPLCGGDTNIFYIGKILNRYNVEYFKCNKCTLISTEKPHWLQEAYSESIASADTGIMVRNVTNSEWVNMILQLFYRNKTKLLDWGGGYGVFVRMMRDLGYEFLWYDKYADNLLARGFEYNGEERMDIVTAFELLEHFEKPGDELDLIFSKTDVLICSTLLYDEYSDSKSFGEWWYVCPDTGQHIVFYSRKTMEYIASKYNRYYYYIGKEFHVFSKRKISTFLWEVFLANSLMRDNVSQLYRRMRRKKSLAVQDMEYINKLS